MLCATYSRYPHPVETQPMLKTHTCGELRTEHIGQTVTLAGWVNRRRDQGGLIFIDLRDRWGITQVAVDQATAPQAHATASEARGEYVLQVQGVVRPRPEGTVNPNLPTGTIEVEASAIDILNTAKTPPFYIYGDEKVDEALRMKYRYLDLRRQRMQGNIVLRHRVIKYIRDFLDARGFVEVETPILFKTTPEGARDYLVPSRVHPGEFYALPQSPQQLKQLLMVAGYERYFQIARCFRDEDQRGDRQPEFTQLDMEMSFVTREDVMALIEALMTGIVENVSDRTLLTKPFRRFKHREAMDSYGSDKPDMRYDLIWVDVSAIAGQSEFAVFQGSVAEGKLVKAMRVPGAGALSGSQLKKQHGELEALAQGQRRQGPGLDGPGRNPDRAKPRDRSANSSPGGPKDARCSSSLARCPATCAVHRRPTLTRSTRPRMPCAATWPNARVWPIPTRSPSPGSSTFRSSSGTRTSSAGTRPTTCSPRP